MPATRFATSSRRYVALSAAVVALAAGVAMIISGAGRRSSDNAAVKRHRPGDAAAARGHGWRRR